MPTAHPWKVIETEEYARWFEALRDERAKSTIDRRISRVRLGNFGDSRSVGDGVSELRIDYGPGYRVYFTREGDILVLLLCGGDKSSQTHDIERAKSLAAKRGSQ